MFRHGALAPAMAGAVTHGSLGSLSTVQSNWVLEKIESYFDAGPELDAVTELEAPFKTLAGALSTAGGDFMKALNDFAGFFTTLNDPKSLATVGVADLLKAAKEVTLAALTLMDGLIDALLEIVGIAIEQAGKLLTAPLSIPILSGIANDIAKLLGLSIPTTSIPNIFCFGLAVPVTIFYKLVTGSHHGPFPGGKLPTGEQLTAMPGSAADAKTAVAYTAAAIAGLWALMDTGLDTVPDYSNFFLGVIDVVAPALLNVFTWPGGIPFEKPPLSSSEDKASFANWIAAWVVVVVDLAALLAGKVAGFFPKITIMRYVDPAGKVAMSLFGAINLTTGIVASSLGTSGANIASNVLGPLPTLTQFLRIEALMDSSEGLTLAIKLIVDFFAGEGYAVAVAAS
jgi:hypothetical protein